MFELRKSALVLLLMVGSVPAIAQSSDDTPAVAIEAPSIARGKSLYESRCGACHSVDANRVGPAHQGVVGRKAGSAPGFDYSKAVAGSPVIWTRTNLLAWLTNPEVVIPGQQMGYSLGETRDREDVVAYLATLKSR